MKTIKNAFRILFLAILLAPVATEAYQAEATNLIFVRHVEKADDGTRNPPINEEGKKRAINLYHVLSADYSVKAIYSTAYKRTEMTAEPIADSLGLDIQNYNFEELDAFLTKIIDENKGGAVLIVGHSNTTPSLVNMALGNEQFEQIDEKSYGDIFIVSTSELGKGKVKQSSF